MMAEGTPFRLAVADGSAGVVAAEAELEAFLAGAGVPERVVSRALLLLEEVSLNAQRHGKAGRVTVEATVRDADCMLVFEDDGAPFDPLVGQFVEPQLEADGGRGLQLIRRLSSDARYTQTETGNRLEVRLLA